MRHAAIALLLFAGQTGARPAFEVVSITRSAALDAGGGTRWQPGGRFTVTNLSVLSLLMTAYGTPQRSLLPSQVMGAPDWVATDRYVMIAKIAPELAAQPQAEWFSALPLLLQSLLEDRFRLKAHREKRELPVYVVRMANADGRPGPQLRRSTMDCEKDRA